MIKLILIVFAVIVLIGILVYFFVPLKTVTTNPEMINQGEKKVPLYEYYRDYKPDTVNDI